MQLSSPRNLAIGTAAVLVAVAGGLAVFAPHGVSITPTLVNLGLLVAGVGLGSAGLFALTTAKNDPDRWANVVRSTCVIVAIVAAGGGVRAALDLQQGAQISDDLWRDAPELGPGAVILRPSLVNARVVVPDRPHDPTDNTSWDRLERTHRTRTFYVNTNSQGYRGGEWTTPAPAFRIACVGDSVTFGWGMTDNNAWPSILGRVLGEDVLNMGIPAGETEMLTRLVEQRVPAVNADIVLFSEWPEWAQPNAWSNFARQLERLQTAVGASHLGIVLPPVSTFDPLRLSIEEGAVARIQSMAGDIPVLDLSNVFAKHQGDGVILVRSGMTQQLVRISDRAVIAEGTATPDKIAMEIIAAFEQDDSLAEPLFFDGGHPTIEGNEIAAQAIAKWMLELGWLPHSGHQWSEGP